MKAMNKIKLMKLLIIAILVNVGLILSTDQAMAQTASLAFESKSPVIEDETLYTLFIPNCFTPNADGTNDKFIVASDLLKRISLRIYDKTGEEVFATIDMNQGWNGEYRGKELKQDAYLYRIEATYMNGEDEVIVGQVNLMR